MKKISVLTTFLLLVSTIGFGQNIQIETLTIQNSNSPDQPMNFPVILTGNDGIDSLINSDLKNRFTDDEFPNLSLESTLKQWVSESIVSLDFQVTLNEKGILSLNISAESCNAYCTNWTSFYNYSTRTGKWLEISDVIDTTTDFKTMVKNDRRQQYEKEHRQLKELESEADQELSNSSLGLLEECKENFSLETFVLYPDRLEIVENCEYPHVIRALEPQIKLSYPYSEIKEYLKF